MSVRHFIDTQDFSKHELLDIIDLIRLIKEADKQGCTPGLLEGKSLAMIFEEPSTRTRVSFEVAMTELGGHALYLKPGEIHLGVRESIGDTAQVLSRMVDAILIRALKHKTVTDFAAFSRIPVINGLTDYNHPTQAICDVFTMIEHMPVGNNLGDMHVTFVGDATNVLSSLMFICTQMGMHFTHAAPKKYQPKREWIQIAEQNCRESGGTIKICDDPVEAVRNADFLYTDLWWWVDQEHEIPERKAAFMPTYQITTDLMRKAPSHCKLMHCLPASRGVEATDEALDSPNSIIFDQAENRLHAEKGILAYFVSSKLNPLSADLQEYHRNRIESFLQKLGKK